LDALLSPPAREDHPIYELHKKFDEPRSMDKIKSAGARLVWINIGNVSPVQSDIEELRMKVWLAKQSGTARLLKAQGEAEKISSRERGQAESQAVLLRSIAQALHEVDSGNGKDKAKTAKNLWNIVLARTAQILESMTSAHENKGKKGAK
jgi:putative component of toxin-antitoxin plasmid stabilization module